MDAKLLHTPQVLKGQTILEVGCGGGILTEQMARLGASVTGIDLGHELIEAAKTHLKEYSSNLSDSVSYKVESVQQHAQTRSNYYDAVVLSEVIEHVDNKPEMLTSCVQALKVGNCY